MTIERISSVIPVDDLASAVGTWSAVLGTEPTFVDGDRWAQFDVGPARIALAGTDRAADSPGLMIKVDDPDCARATYQQAGIEVGDLTEGEHEVRFELLGLSAPVTVYAST